MYIRCLSIKYQEKIVLLSVIGHKCKKIKEIKYISFNCQSNKNNPKKCYGICLFLKKSIQKSFRTSNSVATFQYSIKFLFYHIGAEYTAMLDII